MIASGTALQTNHYDPFGNDLYSNPGEVNPYKYSGKEWDSRASLYDFSARMYNPFLSRFTMMDPLAEKYYSISPYAYCANNPVIHVDPEGLDYWLLHRDGTVTFFCGNEENVGAHTVIDSMRGCFPRLKKILADGGYKGQKLIDAVRQKLGAEFSVVLRPDESSKKFNVLPLRWIVERSFSWLESFRRIAMDYEFYSDTGEAMVQLAFCRLMYNKIYD